MNTLLSLVNFFKSQTPKVNFISKKAKDSQIKKLYLGIEKGKIKTSQEAKNYVYGKNGNGDFGNLKRRLNEILVDNILHLVTDKWTENQEATYKIYRQYAASKILLVHGNRDNQISIAKRIFQQALKYEMCEIVLSLGRDIMMYYGTVQIDEIKQSEFAKIVKEYSAIVLAESKIEILYSEFTANHFKTLTQKSESKKQLNQLLKTIESYHNKYKCSWKISIYYYSFKTYSLQAAGDIDGVIAISEECLNFFLNKRHNNRHYQLPYVCYFFSYFILIPTAIYYKEYDKVESLVERCLNLAMKGSSNWHYVLRHSAQYAFHSDNPTLAYQVMKKARKTPSYEHNMEYWKMVEGYLYLYQKVGKFDSSIRLSSGKFNNDFLDLQKDKEGYNMHIRIIHFMIMLAEGKQLQLMDRDNAHRLYLRKYINEKQQPRTSLFLNLMIKLIEKGFDMDLLASDCEEFVEQLEINAINAADRDMNSEIVPYENLWDILNLLLEPITWEMDRENAI